MTGCNLLVRWQLSSHAKLLATYGLIKFNCEKISKKKIKLKKLTILTVNLGKQ